MKIFAVLFVLFGSLSAQASFYQVTCTNSDQSVVYSYGHLGNELSVTKYIQRSNVREKIMLERSDLIVETSDELIMFEEENKNCDGGHSVGIFTYNKVSALKLLLTKNEGTFPRQTLHASEDLTTVSTYLICETELSSLSLCDKDDSNDGDDSDNGDDDDNNDGGDDDNGETPDPLNRP